LERQTETEGGQYCLNFEGCSPDSFGVIRQGEKYLFEKMLKSHNVVTNHPQKDEEYMDAVAAMKPYWGDRKGTCDWIDS